MSMVAESRFLDVYIPTVFAVNVVFPSGKHRPPIIKKGLL